MDIAATAGVTTTLSKLPSIDVLIRNVGIQDLISSNGAEPLTALAQAAVSSMRKDILSGDHDFAGRSAEDLLAEAVDRVRSACTAVKRTAIGRIINATGVIIHTNLGRAPLSEAAKSAILSAAGYSNVEYDLETGARGQRGRRAAQLAADLCGAESALIVNNCAAAAFLVLTVFASGGEVVISRGELVEIGGDFRVPDVLEQSGATLCEVGTTNRTKLADYEKAIGENTRMILRVHPSNYRIVGFTAMPSIAALADLAHKHGVIIFEDIGSGALIDLAEYGLDEPVVSRSIAAGVDIVTFSGDKLLGGPQSGIIAGRRELIERIRKHPLYRALRVDKLAYAALEATLGAYSRGSAETEVPVLKMIAASPDGLRARAGKFAETLRVVSSLTVETMPGTSVIGGGAAPDVKIETTLVSLVSSDRSAEAIEASLRSSSPPVIARIENDRVLIDLRTVSEIEETELSEIITGLFSNTAA